MSGSPPASGIWLGVLGRPVAHSISPLLHEAGLAALGRSGDSIAVDVGPRLFAETLAWLWAAGWTGGNVTAPHKEAALRLARSATDAARRAGSANCLRRTAEGHEATNTDGAGFLAYLQEIGVETDGARVAILGGGGAAAGLAPALADAGAEITVVARDPARAQGLAGLRERRCAVWGSSEAGQALLRAALVVHATPLGGAESDPLPCPPEALGPSALAIDLRYGPTPSPWVRAVRASGRPAYDGLGLLLQQCVLSFAFWFDEAPPLSRLREAVPWLLPESRRLD